MNLIFSPEDFDAVITANLLESILSDLISTIRAGDVTGQSLRQNIEILSSLAESETFSKDSDIISLFRVYEQIKKVSMKIRQLLSPFIQLDTYDSIGYVFYYNNQRFVADEIKTEWLIRGSKGSLSIDLEKATSDIAKNYSDKAQTSLRDIFNQHYASYLAAISGMYEKHAGYPLGAKVKGSKLNKGHVAEAYESHLASHHSVAYNLLNSLNIDSVANKAIISKEIAELQVDWWASHESPDGAWAHIRSSMGTQRGTVAGDVGRYQVKQGSNNSIYGAQVRLSSLANLKRGVKDYCDIINPDIPVQQLAHRLAIYLSETVGQPSKELQAYIANKEFGGDVTQLKQTKIIHI